MAANSKRLLTSGKRLIVDQIRAGTSPDLSRSVPLSLSLRRGVHGSVYDKNLDDQVRGTVVPDDVIQPQSEKYWSPHPKTGVFGPTSDHNTSAATGSDRGFHSGGNNSMLEEKAFFRPLEGLEKPSEDEQTPHSH